MEGKAILYVDIQQAACFQFYRLLEVIIILRYTFITRCKCVANVLQMCCKCVANVLQ